MRKKAIHTAFLLLLAIAAMRTVSAQTPQTRDASFSHESMLRVTVEGGYGTVIIKRTGGEKVYVFTQRDCVDEPINATVDYQVRSGRGYLNIELNERDEEKSGFFESLSGFVHGGSSHEWCLELTDRIPVELSLELGAGNAKLDLTGLRLSGLKLELGASDMNVVAREKNPVLMRSASISAGVGNIKSEGLGNLNFERLSFEGGLGSYHLDMTGAIRNDACVSAEIGLGSLVVVFPNNIGVRLKSEDNFFSSTHYQRFVRLDDDTYETPAYDRAERRISMSIDSGIGSVSVNWKK
jgi:hypothetical protein